MEELDSQHESTLKQLLADYAASLKTLASEAKLSSRQVLKVLRTRDRIQDALSQISQVDDESLANLVELDLELKQQANNIGHAQHFDQLRQSLQPPDSAWWWHLEPPTEVSRSKPFSVKFDWFWNVGTVACLVFATSFITQTAKAFSTEGFDFLGTLSTISQGAGLAFVAGGALTDKGRQAVSQSLSSVNIPPSLHAEATFAASLLLLGTTYSINQNLHLAGNWYFDQGQRHEQQGEGSQAFKAYKRALNFAPDDYKTQIAVGFLHEKLGNFDQAIEDYKKGTAFGIPEFLNAQARAMLMGALQKNDWQGGVDEKVIREAKNLLERAEKSTYDLSSREVIKAGGRNPRLRVDITINQAIAKLAAIKPNQKLDKAVQERLSSPIKDLIYLKSNIQQSKSKKTTDLTTASIIGDNRAECYHQRAYYMANQVDPSQIYGIDLFVKLSDVSYACMPIQFSSSISTLTDRAFLRNYNFSGKSKLVGALVSEATLSSGDISALMVIVYLHGYYDLVFFDPPPKNADKVILIQDPKRWLELSSKLAALIQKNYTQTSYGNPISESKQQIIWRFILGSEGQILGYFAYNSESLSVGQSQSFLTEALEKNLLKQLGTELEAGKPLEFADFKVVLSPQGKILQLLPWSAAYPAWNERCKQKCKNLFLNPQVKAAFKSYTPNLNDSAELGALEAVLKGKLSLVGIRDKGGIYYDDPSIFKLKSSSDGQVIQYKAINSIAMQKFGRDSPFEQNLKSLQFPKLQKAPYIDFKLEARGISGQLTPWLEPK
jgi:tetratricopeptide (TPR) repeat protein